MKTVKAYLQHFLSAMMLTKTLTVKAEYVFFVKKCAQITSLRYEQKYNVREMLHEGSLTFLPFNSFGHSKRKTENIDFQV